MTFSRFSPRRFLVACALLSLPAVAHADWQRTATSLAWTRPDGAVVWRFSFDQAAGKPFFHPLTVAGGPSLTNFKPSDHPWHYGLWFSWKYLNHVNYWEESAATGQAEGRTRWTPPTIETHSDGRAVIHLALTYENPDGEVVLREARFLQVSAPAADGSYAIDWRARFNVGGAALELDRTPMPNEPSGQINGGYAGLGARLAAAPLTFAALTTAGPVTEFASDRARPAAPAIAFNFADGSTPVGGLAILSASSNAGENAPWYLVNSATMRFACAAILAPAPRHYTAGATFELRYRIALQRALWTPSALADAWRTGLQP